jgi:hypothetical protein
VELGIVRAEKRDSLRPELIVEIDEGFGVAPDGSRVVGDLGSVLVLNNTQLERIGLVLADVVRGGAYVQFFGYAWCVECFWMAAASGARIDRQIFLLQV